MDKETSNVTNSIISFLASSGLEKGDMGVYKASDYIIHFKKLFASNNSIKVVLYCRVSRCWQKHRGNLRGQRKYLKKWISHYEKKYGVKIVIVAVFCEVASGWSNGREKLIAASKEASKHGAVLLAESACRFIRNKKYHSFLNPDVLPIISEYESLIKATKGVKLTTILPPDTSWKKVKSYHTKRGQRSKNKFGGHPLTDKPGYKKQRRLENLNTVLDLHKKGCSLGNISKKTGIAKSTVADWIRIYKK